MMLAWGQKVSDQFGRLTIAACKRLGIDDPSWLMACMAFETGRTFSPCIRNAAGSGAVGLIQFMPSTAGALGTSVEELATLKAEDQLLYVELYFKPWSRRLHSLGDVYGAILWPGMIGKLDTTVIFEQGDEARPKLYLQNKGLDLNHDGHITRGEIIARVQKELAAGLTAPNVLEVV
jgi:hypothetical protein